MSGNKHKTSKPSIGLMVVSPSLQFATSSGPPGSPHATSMGVHGHVKPLSPYIRSHPPSPSSPSSRVQGKPPAAPIAVSSQASPGIFKKPHPSSARESSGTALSAQQQTSPSHALQPKHGNRPGTAPIFQHSSFHGLGGSYSGRLSSQGSASTTPTKPSQSNLPQLSRSPSLTSATPAWIAPDVSAPAPSVGHSADTSAQCWLAAHTAASGSQGSTGTDGGTSADMAHNTPSIAAIKQSIMTLHNALVRLATPPLATGGSQGAPHVAQASPALQPTTATRGLPTVGALPGGAPSRPHTAAVTATPAAASSSPSACRPASAAFPAAATGMGATASSQLPPHPGLPPPSASQELEAAIAAASGMPDTEAAVRAALLELLTLKAGALFSVLTASIAPRMPSMWGSTVVGGSDATSTASRSRLMSALGRSHTPSVGQFGVARSSSHGSLPLSQQLPGGRGGSDGEEDAGGVIPTSCGEACEALVHAADTLVALRSKSEALAAAEAQGAELRGKLETAQQDLTLMRNTLADAGASANRAQTPPPASSAATSALQAEVASLKAQVKALQAAVAARDAELVEASGKVGRAGGEREALQQEIEQLRSQAASVQAANDQATARAEDLQRDLDSARQALKDQGDNLELLRAQQANEAGDAADELSSLKRLLACSEAAARAAQAELEALRSRLAEAEGRASTLAARVITLEQERDALQAQLAMASQRVGTLEVQAAAAAAAASQNAALQAQLRSARAACDTADSAVKSLQSQLGEARAQNLRHEAQAGEMRASLDAAARREEVANSRIADGVRRLEERNTRLDALQAELREALAALEEAQAKAGHTRDAEARARAAERRAAAAEEAAARAEAAAAELATKCSRLGSDLSQMRETDPGLDDERARLAEEMKKVEAMRAQLTREAASVKAMGTLVQARTLRFDLNTTAPAPPLPPGAAAAASMLSSQVSSLAAAGPGDLSVTGSRPASALDHATNIRLSNRVRELQAQLASQAPHLAAAALKAEEAEAAAAALRGALEVSEQRAAEAEARATQADARAAAAEQRLQTAEGESAQARQESGQAGADAARAHTHASQAKRQAEEAEARATQAEARATQADTRVASAEQQAQQAEANIADLQQRLADVEKRLQDSNGLARMVSVSQAEAAGAKKRADEKTALAAALGDQVEKLRARESELERELAAAKAQLPTWCQPVRVHESASANSLARPMSAASHATTGSKLDLHGLATASAAARPPSPATQAADGGGGGGWGLQGDSRGPSRELSSDRVMARGMSSGLPSSTEDYEALLAELARARADLVLLASKLEGAEQTIHSQDTLLAKLQARTHALEEMVAASSVAPLEGTDWGEYAPPRLSAAHSAAGGAWLATPPSPLLAGGEGAALGAIAEHEHLVDDAAGQYQDQYHCKTPANASSQASRRHGGGLPLSMHPQRPMSASPISSAPHHHHNYNNSNNNSNSVQAGLYGQPAVSLDMQPVGGAYAARTAAGAAVDSAASRSRPWSAAHTPVSQRGGASPKHSQPGSTHANRPMSAMGVSRALAGLHARPASSAHPVQSSLAQLQAQVQASQALQLGIRDTGHGYGYSVQQQEALGEGQQLQGQLWPEAGVQHSGLYSPGEHGYSSRPASARPTSAAITTRKTLVLLSPSQPSAEAGLQPLATTTAALAKGTQ